LKLENFMSESISRPGGTPPFTHTAYLFIRIGATKRGRVYGYWKDGGKFRAEDGPFAFIDMLPRGGWDGRIRFVKAGDPPPGSTEPERPEHGGGHGDDHDDGEEETE
jgi:hypothetical protein